MQKYYIDPRNVYEADADGKPVCVRVEFFVVNSSGRAIKGPFSSKGAANKEVEALERLQEQERVEDGDHDPGNSPSFKP